jgi:hypothetical protein
MLLYLKGLLFLGLGLLASGLLIGEHPEWRTLALLAIAVWAFSRAYYFAFYVVEHYIDPGFRYAGLFAFFRYALHRRSRPNSGRKAHENGHGVQSGDPVA